MTATETLERFDNEDDLLNNGSGWVGIRDRNSDPLPGRAVNSGDLLKNGRGAVVLPIGFTSPATIEPLSVKPTIHADGTIVPALKDPTTHLTTTVRLKGWADFGREDTVYEHLNDGTTRETPEC